MNKLWDRYRQHSRGWEKDSIAIVHLRILLGPAFKVDNLMDDFGITHVVNCAGPEYSSKKFIEEFPGRHACISALDSVYEDITKWYPLFESTMNMFLTDPSCRIIYVHCQCGINRSAFLLLIFICLKFDVEPEAIIRNILIQRPCAFTNITYREQALEYIKKHRLD